MEELINLVLGTMDSISYQLGCMMVVIGYVKATRNMRRRTKQVLGVFAILFVMTMYFAEVRAEYLVQGYEGKPRDIGLAALVAAIRSIFGFSFGIYAAWRSGLLTQKPPAPSMTTPGGPTQLSTAN